MQGATHRGCMCPSSCMCMRLQCIVQHPQPSLVVLGQQPIKLIHHLQGQRKGEWGARGMAVEGNDRMPTHECTYGAGAQGMQGGVHSVQAWGNGSS